MTLLTIISWQLLNENNKDVNDDIAENNDNDNNKDGDNEDNNDHNDTNENCAVFQNFQINISSQPN